MLIPPLSSIQGKSHDILNSGPHCGLAVGDVLGSVNTGGGPVLGRRIVRGLRARPYVLIEPEQVRRIVATLDLSEPLQCWAWVGFADAPLALIAEEANIRSVVTLAQGGRKVGDPGLIDRRLIGALVKRGDVHHNACATMGEGGGVSR